MSARVRDDVPYTKEEGGVCTGQAAGLPGPMIEQIY